MAERNDTTIRRDFLRGLAKLPLIGGGITLIGQPALPLGDTRKQLLQVCSFCERGEIV
jgi:hypothetical protein